MSEYTEVEQPFLHQVQELGWQMIDQGPDIPADPAKSLRQSFRQWILPEVFARSVSAINTTPDGQPWLTQRQIQDLQDQILRQPNRKLLEVNEAVEDAPFEAPLDADEPECKQATSACTPANFQETGANALPLS